MSCQPSEFKFKPAGETSEAWVANLVADAWRQQELLRHRPLMDFYLINSLNLQERDLYEWVVRDDSGRVVAGIVAAEDYNQHTGACLNVRWAISTEPGLLLRGYRKLYTLAKYLELPFIVYTKEIAPSTYEVRYKKVKLDV